MSIGVVIVTYNRIEKLKQCLKNFEEQTLLPNYMIIVDNCSTDGTKEFLDDWKKESSKITKIVFHEKSNVGGSGGFYRGLQIAINENIEWIWVGDDDAIPKGNALELARNFINSQNRINLAAVCASVHTSKGIDLTHRRDILRHGISIKDKEVPLNRYSEDYFEFNAYSFVGSILSLDALKKAGLPKKEYFIWYDDTDHSLRMSKVGKIVCVPRIIVYHPEAVNSNICTWKEYYGIRNELGMIKDNFPIYCYLFKCIKRLAYILLIAIKGDGVRAKMYITAFNDAIHNKYGKNAIYKPGWKAK